MIKNDIFWKDSAGLYGKITEKKEMTSRNETGEPEFFVSDSDHIYKRDAGKFQEMYGYTQDSIGRAYWDYIRGRHAHNEWEDMELELVYLDEESIREYQLRELDQDPIFAENPVHFHEVYDRASPELKTFLLGLVNYAYEELLSYRDKHDDFYLRNFAPGRGIPHLAGESFLERIETIRIWGSGTKEDIHGEKDSIYVVEEQRFTPPVASCIIQSLLYYLLHGYKIQCFLVYEEKNGYPTEEFKECAVELRMLVDLMKEYADGFDFRCLLCKEDDFKSYRGGNKQFLVDLESGDRWEWELTTTPGGAWEDGYYYLDPKKIQGGGGSGSELFLVDGGIYAEMDLHKRILEKARPAVVVDDEIMRGDRQEIPTEVFEEVVLEADDYFMDRKRKTGFCHIYWAYLKKTFTDRGYEWFSPEEQHPDTFFD